MENNLTARTSGPADHPRPRQMRRSFRRGTALLPSLFTVANLGMGWYALQQTCLALQSLGGRAAADRLDLAAKAIGWAILLDGMDGRIARLTGSSSAFGREFDSLADVISFGVAPALLGFIWGLRFLTLQPRLGIPLNHAGELIAFLFVVACAARLARFNLSGPEASPSNPGRPDRKYFVGMPAPAAAGLVAAVVHFFASPHFLFNDPNQSLTGALLWLTLLLAISYLMVSRWRFFSFKDIDLRRRRRWVTTVAVGLLLAGIWYFSEVLLLLLAVVYVGTAIYWRLEHRLRRRPSRGESQ